MGGYGKGKGKGKSPSKGKGKGQGKPVGGKAAKGGGKDGGKVWSVKKPTVLVTGATGFVAGHVVSLLVSKGYTVRGTVRSLADEGKVAFLKELSPQVELFEADLLNGPDAFEKAAEGCKYVFHCASPFMLSGITDAQKQLVDPALKGTESVMKACIAAKVSRVVVTSSVAAIGPPQGWMANPEEADTEKSFTEEDWNTTSSVTDGPYRYSKTVAEKKAWEMAKEAEIELATICPSFVIGPLLSSRTDGESVSLIKRALNGELAESPVAQQCASGVIDVRDVAAAHVAAIEKAEAAGKRFICSSTEGVSHFELAQYLKKGFSAYPLPTEGKEPGYRCKYDNTRLINELKVKPRRPQISFTGMAASAVKLGIVERKYKLKTAQFAKVSSISPESRGVNLMLKVISSTTLEERDRGETVVEVVAGDSSGVVTLRLNEKEAEVAAPGKTVSLRNGFVRMLKGYIRLRAGKWAKIAEETVEEEIVPLLTNDLSATEYELVEES